MRRLLLIVFGILLIGMPVCALAAQRDITIYAYHDPIEKIITYGRGGNYPEAALVSLVLTEIDPLTGKRIFYRYDQYDTPLEIKIESTSSSDALYTLSFILDGAPLSFSASSMDISADPPKWKGLFYGYGNSTDWLPLELDPLPESIPTPETAKKQLNLFTKGAFSPLKVLTVYNWNYHSGASSIDLKISAKKEGSSVKVVNPNITVSIDMDNFDFVRQKVPQGQEATFHGDPGLFIVKGGGKDFFGNDRTYNQIGQVISDIQQGKSQVSGGGGPDWLQVAAIDTYNNAYYNAPSDATVFNRVNKIITKRLFTDSMEDYGLAEKGVVYLNPYLDDMRFNKPAGNRFGFHHYHIRDGIISHEALHAYILSAVKGWLVENKESDSLCVEGNSVSKRHIIFSNDSWGRGFVKLSQQKKNYVEQYLNGEAGDNVVNKFFFSLFLEGLSADANNALLTGNAITFLSQSAPKDLPMQPTRVGNPQLYAYKPVTGAPDGSCFTLAGLLQKPWTIEGVKTKLSDGYYTVRPIKFETIGNKKNEAVGLSRKKLSELLKQGYGLYMGFDIFYGFGLVDFTSPPEEFDAYYFGIGGGR